jgi:hypothetical protein
MPGICSRSLLSVNPEARHTKLNLTGSIKRHGCPHSRKNKTPPRHIIVEATGGTSGILFAAIGRVLGHPMKIFIVGTGWSTNLELPNEPLTLQAFGLAGRINWLANR